MDSVGECSVVTDAVRLALLGTPCQAEMGVAGYEALG